MWLAWGIMTSCDRGIAPAMMRPFSAGTRWSVSPWMTSVGIATPPIRPARGAPKAGPGGHPPRAHPRHRIVCHRWNRVRTAGHIAAADAAVVVHDRPVVRRGARPEPVPPLERGAEAHDQEQRLFCR